MTQFAQSNGLIVPLSGSRPSAYESARHMEWQIDLLTERLSELELGLEDVGWQRATTDLDREISREGLRQICKLARLMWIKNPLVQRMVSVQTHYVFGQDLAVHARADAVNEAVQAFLDDEKNKAELTSHQARMIKESELQVFGNLFFVFFVDRASGRVRVRTIPFDEIDDVIANPDDAKEPWFYKRVWSVQVFDFDSGAYRPEQHTEYYPDWRYHPRAQAPTIAGKPVNWDTPVYHVKVNCLSDMKFGISEVYAAIDWAKAYKEFLEDWATITRAYARFAWNLTVRGGKAGVAAAKSKLGTTFATGGTGYDTNPPPVAGSTFIGSDGVTLNPVRTAGAQVSPQDGRRLMLMVAAVAGIPETFFGDATAGALATARSLDRPTELKFASRQTLWTDIYKAILGYVVLQAVRAPGGSLANLATVSLDPDGNPVLEWTAVDDNGNDIDGTVEVQFPALLEHDKQAEIGAIVDAATLKGQARAGTMDDRTLSHLILSTLGLDDVDELVAQLFPDAGTVTQPPSGKPVPSPNGTQPTAESMMVEAVREMRAALVRMRERYEPLS